MKAFPLLAGVPCKSKEVCLGKIDESWSFANNEHTLTKVDPVFLKIQLTFIHFSDRL